MRRVAYTTILALTALIMVLAAHADQIDGKTALKKMIEAEGKVNFIAHEVTTLSRGPALTSEQTVYRAGSKGMRMEYTSPAALKGEIRVDDGRVLAHYIPKKNVLRTRPSRIASLHSWASHSGRAFEHGGLNAQIVGKDKIAGRSAYIVEIKPRVRDRMPSRKIWIDTEKWIKLKTDEVAPDGTMLSTSYFTKIDFVRSIPPEKFHLDTPPGVRIEKDEEPSHVVPIEQVRKHAGFRILEPSYLPTGFKPAGAMIIPFRDGKIIGIRYTNGVSTVSLFQTPGDKLNPRFVERLNHGPAKSGSEVYTWREGNISLTIVGRISQDEIRRIAGSVK